MKNRTKCKRTKCQITRTLTLILNHTLMVTGSLPYLSFSLHTHTHTLMSISLYVLPLYLSLSLSLHTHTLSLSLFPSLHTLSISISLRTLSISLHTHTLSLSISLHSVYFSLSWWLNMSLSCRMVSMVLYFYLIPIIIYILYYLVFKILSSFVRDSSYHDMYYKGCGLLCAHKKSFNTAIPVRSLGPYMYVHALYIF